MNITYWPIYQSLLYPYFLAVIGMVVYAYFLYKSIKKDRGRKHIKRSKNTLKDILNGKNKKVELSLACLILIISLTTGIYDSFDMINKDFKEMNGTIIKIENGNKNPLTQEITIKNNSETLELYVRRIDVRDHPDIFKIGEVVQIEFAKRTNIIIKAS